MGFGTINYRGHRVQFLQWLHEYFWPFAFVVVHRRHKRIPERLIRNGLFSLLVFQNFLTHGCHVVQAPSATHLTGDRERGSEGHSWRSTSRTKSSRHMN